MDANGENLGFSNDSDFYFLTHRQLGNSLYIHIGDKGFSSSEMTCPKILAIFINDPSKYYDPNM